jgi:uncharacterized protein (TIGR03437 family)
VTPTPTVVFGAAFARVLTTPLFAGLTPTFAGLFQVNVAVPAEAHSGPLDMLVTVADVGSNTITIYVQ